MSSETTDFNPGTKGNARSYVVNSKAPKGDTVDETVGTVTSDSLAAESISSGGAFAQNNPNAAISSVKGAQSTLNNDDTTDARVLHAAGNREERDIGANVASTQYPAQAGQPGFTGTASQTGYAGGPTSTSTSTGGAATSSGTGSHVYPHPHDSNNTPAVSSESTNLTTSSGVGSRPYIPTAPTAAYAGGPELHATNQPKGTNLRENEDIAPGKITFTGDVGGPNDPGRLAEQNFQRLNASAGADSGLQKEKKQGAGDDGGNVYNELSSSERA